MVASDRRPDARASRTQCVRSARTSPSAAGRAGRGACAVLGPRVPLGARGTAGEGLCSTRSACLEQRLT